MTPDKRAEPPTSLPLGHEFKRCAHLGICPWDADTCHYWPRDAASWCGRPASEHRAAEASAFDMADELKKRLVCDCRPDVGSALAMAAKRLPHDEKCSSRVAHPQPESGHHTDHTDCDCGWGDLIEPEAQTVESADVNRFPEQVDAAKWNATYGVPTANDQRRAISFLVQYDKHQVGQETLAREFAAVRQQAEKDERERVVRAIAKAMHESRLMACELAPLVEGGEW